MTRTLFLSEMQAALELSARLLGMLDKNNVGQEHLDKLLKDKAAGRRLAGYLKAGCPKFVPREDHPRVRTIKIPSIRAMSGSSCFVGKEFAPSLRDDGIDQWWPGVIPETGPTTVTVFTIDGEEELLDPNLVLKDLLRLCRDAPFENLKLLIKAYAVPITLSQFSYLLAAQQLETVKLEFGTAISCIVERPDGILCLADGCDSAHGARVSVSSLEDTDDCVYSGGQMIFGGIFAPR